MSKRSINHEAVIQYAKDNPSATQAELAKLFSATKWTIGVILRGADVKGIHRGGAPKRKATMTDEEYEWELILHKHGLGLDRGMRLGRKPIHYGYDPRQAGATDFSATSNPTLNS